jgi:MoxR-like ATPase
MNHTYPGKVIDSDTGLVEVTITTDNGPEIHEYTHGSAVNIPNGTLVEMDFRKSRVTGELFPRAVRIVQPETKSHNWEKRGKFYFSKEVRTGFDLALFSATRHGFGTLLLHGASGVGKTSAIYAMADWINDNLDQYPDIKRQMEAHGISEIASHVEHIQKLRYGPQLLGRKDLVKNGDGSETKQTLSLFTEMIERGFVIIGLDEINRTAPSIANILLSLLDFQGRIEVDGYEIKRGPMVIVVATINEKFWFTGTTAMDLALRRRFRYDATVTFPPPNVQVDILMDQEPGLKHHYATVISAIFAMLRSNDKLPNKPVDISPDAALSVAESTVWFAEQNHPNPVREAFQYTVMPKITEKSVEPIFLAALNEYALE